MYRADLPLDINIHHVTRIEGHANIRLRATDGVVEQVLWQIPEAPRFFEAMVRGRRWDEIQPVACRICGICSMAHSLAAIKAVEDAMGVAVSEQTDKLRILALYGELLESHFLHLGYLVLPDLVGTKSVVPLVSSHTDLVHVIVRLHKLGNIMMEVLGGRRTHPVSLKVGGFAKLPTQRELDGLKTAIEQALPDFRTFSSAVLSLAENLPNFERRTEYVALVEPGVYTFYHGAIGSSDTARSVPVQQFKSVVNEYVSPQSTAKFTKWHRESYAVGALARLNINAGYLTPLAAETARSFGFSFSFGADQGFYNPYMNNVAQLVECAQVMEHSTQLLDEILSAGIKPEMPTIKPKAGWGVGAVEAPRGILFHNYAFDEFGVCTGANMVIPTNQNHANIQKDLEALAPQIIDRPPEEIRLLMEMLVRAYDPCVSCSTHYLDIEFV